MAITHDDIAAAAEELIERGENPTLAAVRATLGSGSFTTISESLKRWRSERAESEATPEIEVPETIAVSAEKFTSSLWSLALETARGEFDDERTAISDERMRFNSERTQLTEALTTLEAEMDVERVRYDSRITTMSEDSDQASTEIEQLSDQIRELEQKTQSIETKRREIAATAKEQGDEIVRLAENSKQLADLHRDQLNERNERIDELKDEIRQAREIAATAESAITAERAESVKRQVLVDNLGAELERVEKELPESREARKQAETDLLKARMEIAVLNTRIEERASLQTIMEQMNTTKSKKGE